MATIGLSFYRFRVCLHNSQKAETENLPLNDIMVWTLDIFYMMNLKNYQKVIRIIGAKKA